LAAWSKFFQHLYRASVTLEELQPDCAALRDLNNWFKDNVREFNIEVLIYAESRETRGFQVVNAGSVDIELPQVRPVFVDADHISICKPQNRAELVFLGVKNMIQRHLEKIGGSAQDAFPPSAAKPESQITEHTVLIVTWNKDSISEAEKKEIIETMVRLAKIGPPAKIRFQMGSLLVRLDLPPDDARRLMDSVASGKLDKIGGGLLIATRRAAGVSTLQPASQQIVRCALNIRSSPPRFKESSSQQDFRTTSWCVKEFVGPFHKAHGVAGQYLPPVTHIPEECVIFLSKERLEGQRGIAHFIYAHSNFQIEGAPFPTKIATNEHQDLLTITRNVLAPPDAEIRDRERGFLSRVLDIFLQRARQTEAHFDETTIKRLHKNSIRFLVSKSLFNEDGSCEINFNGATRWARIAG
jgi:hypothetical protein